MQIGQVIRRYRKSKKMTQEELASRLGLTAPTSASHRFMSIRNIVSRGRNFGRE